MAPMQLFSSDVGYAKFWTSLVHKCMETTAQNDHIYRDLSGVNTAANLHVHFTVYTIKQISEFWSSKSMLTR